MDPVVRLSRRATAVTVPVAVVLGAIAGALAGPTLRRQAREAVELPRPKHTTVEPSPLATSEPMDGDPAAVATAYPTTAVLIPSAGAELTMAQPTPPVSEGSGVSAECIPVVDRDSPSRRARARAFARGGWNVTVFVLFAIAAGTAFYANLLRPDDAIPNPWPDTNIAVIFGSIHPARSPITMDLWLREGDPGQGSHPAQVTMDLDLKGKDLAYPGWEVLATVPRGVQMVGAVTNDPRSGKVSSRAAGGATVYVTPGPQRDGKYTMTLIWNDLNSGPIQVQGANLTAAFPDLTVQNTTSASSGSGTSLPTPKVTLSRELQPGTSDYAYLGGLPLHIKTSIRGRGIP
jgi:hypothetical protein